MEKTRREFVKMVGGAAVAASAVLASHGKAKAQAAKPAKGVPSDPVKIGVLPILTGVAGVPGLAGARGAEIWLEQTNAAGGILGRKVEFYQEEETSPKDTVEKFRKLTLQNKVDVISGGISTAVGLALGPVAEELGQLWLSWDATTQKGVEETMPTTKYSFRSVDNEMEAVGGGIMTAKHFPKIKTVAGINNDYSYGRDCWDTYKAVLTQLQPECEVRTGPVAQAGRDRIQFPYRFHQESQPGPSLQQFLVRGHDDLLQAGRRCRPLSEDERVLLHGRRRP